MDWASDAFHFEPHLPMLSPRGCQQTNFLTSGPKDIHSGTRASAVPSQELSAQLAGESCGVTGVGSWYPMYHTRNKPQRYPQ